ncbi:AraC family transcriptional regulator [Amycolatopsis sp. NPDC006131]|uniref:helix-turn-helix domain-containing protein n=1 Tax=Amycolatopsis sp. NPDC006131 TaxID=3156731 RepID=UPI0033A73CA0
MTWRGTATLRPGRLGYRGTVGDAHRHRHAAVQVVLADEPVRLRGADGGEWCRSAVIPAGAEHEMHGGAAGQLIWVDATGVLGRSLLARVRGTGLPAGSPAAWRAAGESLAEGWADEPTSLHPALRRAVEAVPAMLDSTVPLAEVAGVAGISASRLGHLFRDEIGLPFRAYVRWARLQRAIEHARAGATLTDAAHAAGFADSAHLTRVCHDMFGLAPSALTRGVRWE